MRFLALSFNESPLYAVVVLKQSGISAPFLTWCVAVIGDQIDPRFFQNVYVVLGAPAPLKTDEIAVVNHSAAD